MLVKFLTEFKVSVRIALRYVISPSAFRSSALDKINPLTTIVQMKTNDNSSVNLVANLNLSRLIIVMSIVATKNVATRCSDRAWLYAAMLGSVDQVLFEMTLMNASTFIDTLICSRSAISSANSRLLIGWEPCTLTKVRREPQRKSDANLVNLSGREFRRFSDVEPGSEILFLRHQAKNTPSKQRSSRSLR